MLSVRHLLGSSGQTSGLIRTSRVDNSELNSLLKSATQEAATSVKETAVYASFPS